MAQTAFILGGGGQIGRAVARRFVEASWEITIGGRTALPVDFPDVGAQFVQVDRADPEALHRAVGDVDVLIDAVAFTAEHGEQLCALAGRVGSVIAISSASVYADDESRSLDEPQTGFPELPVPITERQPTVAPGLETYSTRKVAMENALLADDRRHATIVRPCAIHGPGGAQLREWFFVKRALDGRRVVPLAHRGVSRFHTTSVENLAELIWLAAARPGRRIVNCGDPDPPTALEIARAIGDVMGYEWTEVLLPGAPENEVGASPWAVPRPFIIDMLTAELELRYRPVTTYPRAVRATVEWLVETAPEQSGSMAMKFDYAAEDAYLASLDSAAFGSRCGGESGAEET